jgi:hypothetical protein
LNERNKWKLKYEENKAKGKVQINTQLESDYKALRYVMAIFVYY